MGQARDRRGGPGRALIDRSTFVVWSNISTCVVGRKRFATLGLLSAITIRQRAGDLRPATRWSGRGRFGSPVVRADTRIGRHRFCRSGHRHHRPGRRSSRQAVRAGRTGPELFAGVERRVGDRDADDHTAVTTGEGDARWWTSAATSRLGWPDPWRHRGTGWGRHLFVSSHAVHVRGEPGSTEDLSRRPPGQDAEELDEETHGPSKVACQDDVIVRYGGAPPSCGPVGAPDRATPRTCSPTGAAGRRRWPGRAAG